MTAEDAASYVRSRREAVKHGGDVRMLDESGRRIPNAWETWVAQTIAGWDGPAQSPPKTGSDSDPALIPTPES